MSNYREDVLCSRCLRFRQLDVSDTELSVKKLMLDEGVDLGKSKRL